jgi:hypothetical protein
VAEAATDEVDTAVATAAVYTAAAFSKKIGAAAPILFGDEKKPFRGRGFHQLLRTKW